VAGMDLAVGIITAVGLVALGLPAAGSMVLGIAVTMLGLVFATIAMVTSQVTENTRVVHGVTGVILGILAPQQVQRNLHHPSVRRGFPRRRTMSRRSSSSFLTFHRWTTCSSAAERRQP